MSDGRGDCRGRFGAAPSPPACPWPRPRRRSSWRRRKRPRPSRASRRRRRWPWWWGRPVPLCSCRPSRRRACPRLFDCAVFLTASVFAAGVLGVLARSFQATAAKAQAIASQDEPALKVEQKQVAPTKPAPGSCPACRRSSRSGPSRSSSTLVADAVGLLLRTICAQVHGV